MRFRVVLGGLIQAAVISAAAADGTVDLLPDPAGLPGITITQPGSYVLVDDITMAQPGPCIVVDADNVTLDLNGHTITAPETQSTTGSLVRLNVGRSNLILRNGSLKTAGTTSTLTGIILAGSGSVLEDLHISNCYYAIHLQGTANVVEKCTLVGNSAGVAVSASANTVRDCRMMSNVYEGISIGGTSASPVAGCLLERNFISSNGASGIFVDVSTLATTVQNNILAANAFGLYVWGSPQVAFLGNNASGNTMLNYRGVPTSLIVSLGTATAPPPATANVEP